MTYNENPKSLKIEFSKRLFLGLLFLIGGFAFWYYQAGNPIDELRLIINGKLIDGYVTKAEEFDYEEETSNSVRIVTKHCFDYYFSVNNKNYKNEVVFNGPLDAKFSKISSYNVYPIKVKYLPRNPNINAALTFEDISFFNWFLRKFLIGGILLIVALSIGYFELKALFKEYKIKIEKKPLSICYTMTF